MDRYLAGEQIDEDVLVTDLERAIARASFFPVIPVCASHRRRARRAARPVRARLPVTARARSARGVHPGGQAADPISCDPAGPLVAEVVKTASDPYVGRVSLVRVFSGTLDPDVPVHVSGHFSAFFGEGGGHEDHDEDERIGVLAHPFGAQNLPAARVVAGDIATIGRLSRAETGDTLSDVDRPLVLRPWDMPEPLLPVAIEAATRSDEDKLSSALGRLAAEDPSLRVEHNARDRAAGALGDGRGARRGRPRAAAAALRRRGRAA